MPLRKMLELMNQGVDIYFEAHPEAWEVLEAYVLARYTPEDPAGHQYDSMGVELKRLLVPELVTRIRNYLHDELGYHWLTAKIFFNYEYSF